jgi:hypothetical protein
MYKLNSMYLEIYFILKVRIKFSILLYTLLEDIITFLISRYRT